MRPVGEFVGWQCPNDLQKGLEFLFPSPDEEFSVAEISSRQLSCHNAFPFRVSTCLGLGSIISQAVAALSNARPDATSMTRRNPATKDSPINCRTLPLTPASISRGSSIAASLTR